MSRELSNLARRGLELFTKKEEKINRRGMTGREAAEAQFEEGMQFFDLEEDDDNPKKKEAPFMDRSSNEAVSTREITLDSLDELCRSSTHPSSVEKLQLAEQKKYNGRK